jgi:ribosome-associated protein
VTAIAPSPRKRRPAAPPAPTLLALAQGVLEDGKAEEITLIDLAGKSAMADHMLIATGRSQRQVVALAERLARALREGGHGRVPIEGVPHGDWVLIDAGDLLIHLFRPEVRAYYNLEKMWGVPLGGP